MFIRNRMFSYPKRSFHTSSYLISNQLNQTQSVIFKINHNGINHHINKNHLLSELEKFNIQKSDHYLVIQVLQTLRPDGISVVADPHILAGIFTSDLNIVPGTGISKVHGNKYQKTLCFKSSTIPIEELIKTEQYEANAIFHSDRGVEASIFSTKDGGISNHRAGSRFIVTLPLALTNIKIEELIRRLIKEKQEDKIYNRQHNNCTHSVARVLIGNNYMNRQTLDTQDALIKIVNKINSDNQFSQNFYDAAKSIGLIADNNKSDNGFTRGCKAS